MKKILHCFIYFAVIGVIGFLFGRIVPSRWVDFEKIPYKCADFEDNGEIYLKLHIKKWQNRVPDMSRIFPGLVPPKCMNRRKGKENILLMLKETCVAELVHWLLCILGLGCFFILDGWYGLCLYLLYAGLGNLPFIMIQRYNRPRLRKILQQFEGRKEECSVKRSLEYACFDSQL